MTPRACLLVVVLAVAGCASAPPPPAIGQVPTADQRAGTPAALAAERQWLRAWFQGTPVVIGQRADGAVTIEVPRNYCFDPGRTIPKPPLAAVLDKAAESLRRVPLAHLTLLAAPDDGTNSPALAMERGAQIQKYLAGRGVPVGTLGKPSLSAAAEVQLRIESAAP